MPLIEQIPAAVAAAQAAREAVQASGAMAVAVATDLTLAGQFGAAWLIVTGGRLRVFELADRAGGAPVVSWDVSLQDLREPRADSLVGGGALQARLDGRVVDLLRYSNAHTRKFGRVAKYLTDVAAACEARARGETAAEPVLNPDEDEQNRRCPHCGLHLPEATKVCPACLKKHRVFMRVLGLMRPYWQATLLVSLLILAGSAASLVPPYLTRPLIDKVLTPGVLPASERYRLLGWLVLALLGMMTVVHSLNILRGRLNAWLSSRLGHSLRTQVYERLQFHSLRFFDKHQTGALMTRITQDTQSLEGALMDGLPFIAVNVLTLIGIGVVLAVMNWKLTLLVLIPGPVVTVVSRLIWKRLRRILHRLWHVRARLHGVLNDSLSGIRVIKAFAQEDQEIDRFGGQSTTMAEHTLRFGRFWTTFFPVIHFVTSLGTLIVWYFGGRQIIDGQGAMSLGTLMAFIAYLGMFYGPLQALGNITDWLARAMTSAERVFELLDSDPDVPDAADAVPVPAIHGRVEFRDVTFGYDAHKPVLKNVTLDVQAGEMIGLVGHSGAGKTTTINLLCRFYDVQEGGIFIDGVDIRHVRQSDLRRQIGVVLQDTFLFNDSILENIRYAKPAATIEEIMAAAKAANAHDFIAQKPDGYDTRVGERGTALSSGERQRVAIARAILHNPRILILDEATSSVDTDTEKQIQDAIARLVKGRTTFAIAHRLSTLRNASRLVVLKKGVVEETGTHDELMAKKGEFHRLVEMQSEMSRIHAIAR